MPTVLQQRNVPDSIRSRSSLDRIDYVDLFTATTDGITRFSPEQWARAGLEDAAGVGGQFVWRVLCGLRLDPRPSPERVAGWTVSDRGDSWLRLEASGWFMSAQLVLLIDEEKVSVATFVRYERPLGALVWPPMSAGHRRAMPGLLRSAARKLERQIR